MRKVKGVWRAKGIDRTYVAPGVFDGLHIGHMAIISEMVSEAKEDGAIPTVMIIGSFKEEPIIPEDLRDRILEEVGVELVVVQELDEGGFRRMSPEDFARDVLSGIIKAKRIFVGADFRFGFRRSGDIHILSELGLRYGFDIRIFEPISVDGVLVKSSSIRKLIREGDVEGASRLLGKRYSVYGVVERGEGRGRSLGFPTANIPNPRNLLPREGVYAAVVHVRGERMKGVAYVGRRPTFGGGDLLLEVHIPGIDIPLVGEEISVEMVRMIRGDMRFGKVEELIKRIKEDTEISMRILREVEIDGGGLEERDNGGVRKAR